MDSHSSGTPVARRLTRPTRTAMWKRMFRRGEPPGRPSLFGLAPSGVCPATTITGRAVRSYRTISPLPAAEATGGMFSVALSLGSPPPDVIRHSASMEPGLSSLDRGKPTADSGYPAIWRRHHGPQAGTGQAVGIGRIAATAMINPMVSASSTPSNRAGRKRRWNAATVSRECGAP